MFTAMILTAIVAHWLGDFVFQTNWMAMNKGKYWTPLLAHVLVYTLIVFLVTVGVGLSWEISIISLLLWIGANSFLHFWTDAITARFSSLAKDNGSTRIFWVIIGADQAVHQLTLILTLPLLQYTW